MGLVVHPNPTDFSMRTVTVIFVCVGEVIKAQLQVRVEYAETERGRKRLADILEGNNKVYIVEDKQ